MIGFGGGGLIKKKKGNELKKTTTGLKTKPESLKKIRNKVRGETLLMDAQE